MHVVLTENFAQLGYGGAACHTLCHAVIELVGKVAFILDVLVISFLSGYFLGNLFKVESRFALSVEERFNGSDFVVVERTQFDVIGTLHLDVVQKAQHAESFEGGMGVGATWVAGFEGTFSHTLALALERALEVKCTFKFPDLLFRQFLPLADGVEFLAIVRFTVGIAVAETDPVAFVRVELVEVVAKVFASGFFHGCRQVADAFLYLSAFGIIPLVQAVAEKTSALCQMIEGAAKDMAVFEKLEVQLLVEATVTENVWVSPFFFVRSLPSHEIIVKGILFFDVPLVQGFIGKIGTPAIANQHFQHFYLAKAATEIMAAGCTVFGAFCCFRRFDALFNLYSFLKDEASFFY